MFIKDSGNPKEQWFSGTNCNHEWCSQFLL